MQFLIIPKELLKSINTPQLILAVGLACTEAIEKDCYTQKSTLSFEYSGSFLPAGSESVSLNHHRFRTHRRTHKGLARCNQKCLLVCLCGFLGTQNTSQCNRKAIGDPIGHHQWIQVSARGPGIDPLRILRSNLYIQCVPQCITGKVFD